MAKYAVCEACKKLYEYNPVSEFSNGLEFIKVTCSNCGYTKETTRNVVSCW